MRGTVARSEFDSAIGPRRGRTAPFFLAPQRGSLPSAPIFLARDSRIVLAALTVSLSRKNRTF
jgi:hypothetical protein